MSKRVWFPALLFCFVLVAGTGVRFLGGNSLFSADIAYKSAGAVAYPGTKTASDTAVTFYMYIDRGQYNNAWEISMEPDFTPSGGPAGFKRTLTESAGSVHGYTDRDEFINRQELELGPKGTWIKLHNIHGELVDKIFSLPGDTEKHSLVRVTGHMLGACTIFSWERLVPVVYTREGYKVLLPGTKQARQFYYQDWFTNINKLFDLRGDKVPIPGT